MKQKTILLSRMVHRGGEQIRIEFPYDRELYEAVKKIDGVKWSHANRCWYVPDEKQAISKIINTLGVRRGLIWRH